jgi:GTP-binding protein
MPGYGYAKVSKKEIEDWEKLSYRYFATRVNLKRVFLLIDSRRGLDKKDEEMINIFNAVAVSYQLVLTKIDELKPEALEKMAAEITEKSKKFPALHPVILQTSSNRKTGIMELRKAIIDAV